MFNRLESGGLVHGAWVVDSTALRERAARREKVPNRIPAFQRDWNVSPLTPDKFFASPAQNPRQTWTSWPRWRLNPSCRTTMIRLGSQIRLTRREIERFRKITDIEPVDIRTLDDLDAYVARCKAHYWGVSQETQFLHWLIDREYAQCRLAA
jgi:hypothetical protein